MPLVLKLREPDLQLPLEKISRVVRVVDQDVLDREELRLVVHDDAGVRGDVALAVRERVEGVDGLVRGHVVRKMDEDLDLLRGHVLNLLDLDLALVLGLQDGVDEDVGCLSVGDLGHRDGVLVDFLDPGAHLHASAPRSVLVVAAVRRAAGREVRVDREVLALENLDRCVDQLVEVVRQNLGGHADGDSLGTLCEKQREAYRQFGRLLVAPVVGCHPIGDLRIEDDLLGELAQTGLDVTGSRVAVAGQNVTPVTLAVDQKSFLAKLHKGSENGLVAVRVVLHRLADDVCNLGVATVIHPEHRVQHTPLYRLQSVNDVRHSPL